VFWAFADSFFTYFCWDIALLPLSCGERHIDKQQFFIGGIPRRFFCTNFMEFMEVLPFVFAIG